jgi:pimeloyl-ACP methyl ester carboxylesterase
MPPFLLIPGNMCDARLWQPVADLLQEAGHTVRHAPPLGQASIAEMVEAVGRVIDEPAVVVVGFSMGAIVAAELARRSPERVAALGLVAFNASADLPERAAARPRQQEAVRQGQLDAIVTDELKPNYLAQANRGDSRLLTIIMDMARALGPEVFVAQSEALRLRPDLQSALSDFRMPVLLACGIEDRLCPPRWHWRWAEMIGANAQVIEVAGAAHLLPLEQPTALADALIGWLAEDALCPTEF